MLVIILVVHVFSVFFFFFKQKTAYEMRISDWSSDVCSSDLICAVRARSPSSRGAVSFGRMCSSTGWQETPHDRSRNLSRQSGGLVRVDGSNIRKGRTQGVDRRGRSRARPPLPEGEIRRGLCRD